VSIGVATLTPEDLTFNTILDRADSLLYEAKQGGRNQVICHERKSALT